MSNSKNNYSDNELVKLIVVDKNTHYFSILYDRYAKYVYNKCFSFVNSEDEAQDLTHDIFIKIYINLKSFKGESKLSTWIYSIVYNFCITYVNGKTKKSGMSEEIIDNLFDDTLDIIDEDNDKDLFEINYAKLQELLKLLPINDRVVLLMKYQDDLSIKEIADIMNLKQSTVKMRLHRAKKKILELREE
ncbi:MAG: RNA polymerase sigma factor [Myroides sp.]|nr:RNA polymerase sigma factor [Myroides sp.]